MLSAISVGFLLAMTSFDSELTYGKGRRRDASSVYSPDLAPTPVHIKVSAEDTSPVRVRRRDLVRHLEVHLSSFYFSRGRDRV
jgi:hypothetical protein